MYCCSETFTIHIYEVCAESILRILEMLLLFSPRSPFTATQPLLAALEIGVSLKVMFLSEVLPMQGLQFQTLPSPQENNCFWGSLVLPPWINSASCKETSGGHLLNLLLLLPFPVKIFNIAGLVISKYSYLSTSIVMNFFPWEWDSDRSNRTWAQKYSLSHFSQELSKNQKKKWD